MELKAQELRSELVNILQQLHHQQQTLLIEEEKKDLYKTTLNQIESDENGKLLQNNQLLNNQVNYLSRMVEDLNNEKIDLMHQNEEISKKLITMQTKLENDIEYQQSTENQKQLLDNVSMNEENKLTQLEKDFDGTIELFKTLNLSFNDLKGLNDQCKRELNEMTTKYQHQRTKIRDQNLQLQSINDSYSKLKLSHKEKELMLSEMQLLQTQSINSFNIEKKANKDLALRLDNLFKLFQEEATNKQNLLNQVDLYKSNCTRAQECLQCAIHLLLQHQPDIFNNPELAMQVGINTNVGAHESSSDNNNSSSSNINHDKNINEVTYKVNPVSIHRDRTLPTFDSLDNDHVHRVQVMTTTVSNVKQNDSMSLKDADDSSTGQDKGTLGSDTISSALELHRLAHTRTGLMDAGIEHVGDHNTIGASIPTTKSSPDVQIRRDLEKEKEYESAIFNDELVSKKSVLIPHDTNEISRSVNRSSSNIDKRIRTDMDNYTSATATSTATSKAAKSSHHHSTNTTSGTNQMQLIYKKKHTPIDVEQCPYCVAESYGRMTTCYTCHQKFHISCIKEYETKLMVPRGQVFVCKYCK